MVSGTALWEWLIGGVYHGYHVKLPWILPFWINYSDPFCSPGLKWSFSKISREYRSFPFQSCFHQPQHLQLVFQVTWKRRSNASTLICTPEPEMLANPICSMYGIFTYIYPTNGPNVGKYTIHGAYGKTTSVVFHSLADQTSPGWSSAVIVRIMSPKP